MSKVFFSGNYSLFANDENVKLFSKYMFAPLLATYKFVLTQCYFLPKKDSNPSAILTSRAMSQLAICHLRCLVEPYFTDEVFYFKTIFGTDG